MKIRNDGSVQSSNVPTLSNLMKKADTTIYRAIITEVIYTDDVKNITRTSKSPRVLYNAVILGGFLTGTKVANCRMSPLIGGDFSFYERVLRPCTKSTSQVGLMDQDGDVVFVQFVQGNSTYPVIVGMDVGLDTTSYGLKGATKEQGRIYRSLFGQVYEEIDQTGNYTKIYGYDLSGSEDHFLVDTVNVEEKTVTRIFKGDMAITQDIENDVFLIKTGKNVTMTLDGNSQNIKIETPSTTIEIDGNSGKIALKGEFVDLGAAVTDMVTKFVELATAFSTHTHIAPQAPSGSLPTSPPIAPLPMTVGSRTVKVQD